MLQAELLFFLFFIYKIQQYLLKWYDGILPFPIEATHEIDLCYEIVYEIDLQNI